MTGILMSGKMSVGVRSAVSGPMMSSSSASTTNVYGRRSATRTMPTSIARFHDPARRWTRTRVASGFGCDEVRAGGRLRLRPHAGPHLSGHGPADVIRARHQCKEVGLHLLHQVQKLDAIGDR